MECDKVCTTAPDSDLTRMFSGNVWYTFSEVADRMWTISDNKLRERMEELRHKRQLMSVKGPGNCGFLWHAYDQRLNGFSVDEANVGDFSEFELTDDVQRQFMSKVEELSKNRGLPLTSERARRIRGAGVVAKRHILNLGLFAAETRLDDGFPFRCQWGAKVSESPPRLGAFRVQVNFRERIPIPSWMNPPANVDQDGIWIRFDTDSHLAVGVDVLAMWVGAESMEVLHPPSRGEIVSATKAKLLQCRSLARFISCFASTPEVKLLSAPG